MSNKIDLNVIEGHRDKLEDQISHALFTIFDQKILEDKLDEIHIKLAYKGKLMLVSDISKRNLPSNSCYKVINKDIL
ncbi:MAG TPA: hypothetical protein VIO87_03385 [Methylotenera sp.]